MTANWILKKQIILQQLIIFQDNILGNDAYKVQSDILYIDFCESFDMVSHSIVWMDRLNTQIRAFFDGFESAPSSMGLTFILTKHLSI